ncbi:50S ribosomal protein L18 [Candidatus Amesbacteria bacterium RIFCSPHIGHO2_01_FULL_47_34]|uniref:Large ribosomal subunit protein uL18 n=4 Tax=Microgenomates group TaxID=1794810 RepID=A0A0H4T3A2_9BACT|nr:50S ribosomal protein L18, large subunit ribosomal protein L18 [uncultured Microgenomates bacterium Rifle_16ft_4_minimus_1180]KKU63231.1 MAG: 50S ribosomal protein L18 [Candidatus Amesbacteria bacterium GW2011_GWC1_47_15]KKU96783.1 MAG: 50S ribosomal protein L18 [Candidatus Amesbacteria bacterium GW2011_GWB1_48_13]OGD00143.1 MAG: 50S ribosomal protein L18 [Candidatus Amesbacteria bacterium RIFCSPHIGHO2_01_FULL_47_34]OGD01542.1 MAG: 50S ribosomal protein L18 [Candidatus Amesbacteria bacterium
MIRRYKDRKVKRAVKTRGKMKGNTTLPRLCVFRSNKYLWVQVIDQVQGKTIAGCRGVDAGEVGKKIAEKAIKSGVKSVVFDRGAYSYHGKVKALAEAAREGGLKF